MWGGAEWMGVVELRGGACGGWATGAEPFG